MPITLNPFTPSFGMVPAIMAGRDQLLRDMANAFEHGPGDPNLSTIIIGARGTGKTALLSCIADAARQSGWVSADVVASRGMLDDIVQRTMEAAGDLVPAEPKKQLTGVNIAQIIGLQWESSNARPANWRTKMNALIAALEEQGAGLLITVDEVNSNLDEMVQLASTYQLFIREGKRVGLVMAGLPKHASSLVSNESVSFLRRARHHNLGNLKQTDVQFAFRKTIENAGKSIAQDALDLAVGAIGGFPYMLQLVGYFSWAESGSNPTVTEKDVARGVQLAQQDMVASVLDATFRELSKGDRTFLYAMLEDEGDSKLANIASRIDKPNGYAATYRNRLLDQGVIEELPGRELRICIPFFREYLSEMADTSE